jgi:hypothetical protein
VIFDACQKNPEIGSLRAVNPNTQLASFVRRLLSVSAAAALFLVGSKSYAQTTQYYNATTLPANPQTGVVHFLQQVTFAGPPGTYTVSSMTFGVNWSDISADQGLFLEFYNGLNLSSGAANVLAGATDLGGAGFLLDAASLPSTGNFTYTLTFGTPITLTSNVIGVEVTMTDSTGANYATGIQGRFSTVAPTTGSSTAFVWNDGNLDGTFTGSEQTTFGQSGAYIRMSMTGTAPVPEPSTWALLAGGASMLAFTMLRRARA